MLGAAMVSESLRKAPHAARLKPIIAAARRAIKGRWNRQRTAALIAVDSHAMKEAVLTRGQLGTLAARAALGADVSDEDLQITGAVTRATRAGVQHGAELLGVAASVISADVARKAVKAALDGVDKVTGQRITEAIEEGESPAVAVQGLFREMAGSRLDSIASYAVNAGYNAGIRAAAEGESIAWDTDGDACERCLENAAVGFISTDEQFPSGDDAPPAHPNCDCVLDVRRAEPD